MVLFWDHAVPRGIKKKEGPEVGLQKKKSNNNYSKLGLATHSQGAGSWLAFLDPSSHREKGNSDHFGQYHILNHRTIRWIQSITFPKGMQRNL